MNLLYCILSFLNVSVVMAANYQKVSGAKPNALLGTLKMLHSAIAQFSLVFGIGFVLLSVYKYTEHRQNPLANPLGRVVSLLLTGAAMIGLYFIPLPSGVA